MSMRIRLGAAALVVCCLCGVACTDTSLDNLATVHEAAAAISPWITDVRRELHTIPELLYNESETSAALRRHLDLLNIPYKCATQPAPWHNVTLLRRRLLSN